MAEPFSLDIRIRLHRGQTVVFGKGVVRLLVLCRRFSSLHKAAGHMGMSYRKALLMVRRAEEGFGQPILERSIGGAGGGGSRLTPFGERLVEGFLRLEADTDAYVAQKLAEIFPDLDIKKQGG